MSSDMGVREVRAMGGHGFSYGSEPWAEVWVLEKWRQGGWGGRCAAEVTHVGRGLARSPHLH